MNPESYPSLFPDHHIKAIWDRSCESVTLGGLLILRQEMEQLAKLCEANRMTFFIVGEQNAHTKKSDLSLARSILKSKYPITIEVQERPSDPVWPLTDEMGEPFFSYQSFGRVVRLTRLIGEPPTLNWDSSNKNEALKLRNCFPGKLYTLHLKQTGQGNLSDSNANMNSWHRFLKEQTTNRRCAFLILGDEEIPEDILKLPGVHKATAMQIPLATQLCLVSLSDGFLGMASGFCQAAILSKTPYVIFKHPQHHPEEMKRELGNLDAFPFASPLQKIWRLEDRVENIAKAFQVVTGDVS